MWFKENVSTLCGQNAEFFNVQVGGTYKPLLRKELVLSEVQRLRTII
jgi:hypothetical protein